MRYLVVLLLAAGCVSAPVTEKKDTCEGIESYFKGELDRYQVLVDDASRDYQLEQWAVETAAPGASLERMSKLFAKLQAVTYNKDIVLKTRLLEEVTRALSPNQCG